MRRGQSLKVKGAICNVPPDSSEVSQTLPHPADSNGLIIVKLKRKLEYKGHVYFEAVRSQVIRRLLEHLKINNSLYGDMPQISPGNQDLIIETTNLLEFLDIDDPMSIVIETSEIKNDLDTDRTAGSETDVTTMLPSRDEITIIAPGEGLTPLFILSDPHCEELA